MPTSITDYGADLVANIITGNATMPATLYVALCAGVPDTGFDGTVLDTIEPQDASYGRQSISMASSAWDVSSAGVCTSLVAVNYSVPAADWGIITHWALCTAATNGEVFGYGEFDVARRVIAGAAFSIPIGGLAIGVGGPENPVVL